MKTSPVVSVELLDISHWEVGLQRHRFVEIHNGCVDLVDEQVHLGNTFEVRVVLFLYSEILQLHCT